MGVSLYAANSLFQIRSGTDGSFMTAHKRTAVFTLTVKAYLYACKISAQQFGVIDGVMVIPS